MMRALATAVVLTAHVGPASAVWQQNMCCRIGGKRLEAGDEKELAKFDIVLTNNMFYQDIQNDTWSAISKINPATKVFACARSLEACTQAAPQHLGRPPAPALESGILRRHAPLFFVRHCTGRRVLADRDTLAADNEDANKMPESNNVARWNVSRGLEQGSLNLDNPDLFLLGKDGKRIYIGSYPHTWLMDVGADRWRQYFIDATVADNFNRPSLAENSRANRWHDFFYWWGEVRKIAQIERKTLVGNILCCIIDIVGVLFARRRPWLRALDNRTVLGLRSLQLPPDLPQFIEAFVIFEHSQILSGALLVLGLRAAIDIAGVSSLFFRHSFSAWGVVFLSPDFRNRRYGKKN